ncbi:MAG TPA: hypothetical protein VJY62_15950 [Bacteroidia bacterium]|nr:hypothetical protein [Bacteroidia bacterium]
MNQDQSTDEKPKAKFWDSTLGALAKVTALITAVSSLVAVVVKLLPDSSTDKTPSPITEIMSAVQKRQDSITAALNASQLAFDSIIKKKSLDSIKNVHEIREAQNQQTIDSLMKKSQQDSLELQKNLQAALAKLIADSTSKAEADLLSRVEINKIIGNWEFKWHSKISNNTLNGNLNIQNDIRRGSNFVMGHIRTSKTINTLYINNDFTGTFTNSRLYFCRSTPCPKTSQCYNVVYNYNTPDYMVGTFTNEGGNDCDDSGSLELIRMTQKPKQSVLINPLGKTSRPVKTSITKRK